MKIGVLGAGKMGEVLIDGLLNNGGFKPTDIQASVRSPEAQRSLAERYGVKVHLDNQALVAETDWVLLCVKPQQARDVLAEITPALTSNHRLLSVCASLRIERVREWSGERCSVVRAMPNTPSKLGLGMTLLTADPKADPKLVEGAKKIFDSVGETLVIDEKLMDAGTALSGCGPAYVYLIIEALSDAGIALGLPRAHATRLVAQTMLGASKMVLETHMHPAELRDQVTTPGGVTIDGVMALEQGNLRAVLLRGVTAAAEKSKKLTDLLS